MSPMDSSKCSVESSTRPGLAHEVDLDAGTCSCEATVKVCRHVRVARIRQHKARLIERYRHELMDVEERLELLEAIGGEA